MALSAISAELRPAPQRSGGRYIFDRLKTLLDRTVSLWIFMGGMVIIEPSPYEFVFAIVLPLALFAGMKVYRSTAPLFLLTVFFAPFAITAAFQATFTPTTTTLVYEAVTIFLLLTSFFVANYVAEAPQERMARIMRAYTLVAVLSSILGTLAYLHLIPGAYDTLTRYGRTKAFFQDPNVFGPFIILPAIFALQRMLLGDRRRIVIDGAIVLVLMIGVFVSFSRAAWGSIAGGAIILFLLVWIFEANARDKVRMLILSMVGVAVLGVALGGLLSIPSVSSLFDERASVEQNYDSGSTGRFGRQGYAFDLALQHPLGIGPAEFRNLEVSEEPHDTYVTVLHVYGWGGGLCFYALLAWTLARAGKALVVRSANRRLLIPVIATFVPLVIEAAIIDIDHWRHLYLLIGMIWGVTSGYQRLQPRENKVTALV
jgi:hypothetical protein